MVGKKKSVGRAKGKQANAAGGAKSQAGAKAGGAKSRAAKGLARGVGEAASSVSVAGLAKVDKTGRGDKVGRPGSIARSGSASRSDKVGRGAGDVDIRAIRRMMDWQLELLERQRVLTLSVLEIVGSEQ